MKIEIEIADNFIPEGYEIIEIGKRKQGDLYLTSYGEICTSFIDDDLFAVKINKIRFRAKKGEEKYFFFNEFLEVKSCFDHYTERDDKNYEIRNYFKNEQDCEYFVKLIKDNLK